LDMLVEDCVVVEVKATESNLKVHSSQVLTYLRLSQRKLGLVFFTTRWNLKSCQ
jgi:GxxExxY protein